MTGIHALAAAASATQKLKMAGSTQPMRIVQAQSPRAQPIRIIHQPREATPISVAGSPLSNF